MRQDADASIELKESNDESITLPAGTAAHCDADIGAPDAQLNKNKKFTKIVTTTTQTTTTTKTVTVTEVLNASDSAKEGSAPVASTSVHSTVGIVKPRGAKYDVPQPLPSGVAPGNFCEWCNKIYKNSGSKTNHNWIHADPELLTCRWGRCASKPNPKPFSRLAYLEAHQQEKHPREWQQSQEQLQQDDEKHQHTNKGKAKAAKKSKK